MVVVTVAFDSFHNQPVELAFAHTLAVVHTLAAAGRLAVVGKPVELDSLVACNLDCTMALAAAVGMVDNTAVVAELSPRYRASADNNSSYCNRAKNRE